MTSEILSRFPIPSYSQCGEDRLILKLFGYREQGTYVDVGCHHPIRFSNTCLLYQIGWRGLVIDADQRVLALFPDVRPEDKIRHMGVGLETDKRTFYIYQDRALNTFDIETAATYEKTGNFGVPTILEVDVRPLSRLLEDAQIESIDFLNVDVEGMDLEVLQTIDWTKWTPSIIAVEDLGLDLEEPSRSDIFRYMKAQGYLLISKCHYTSIYSQKAVVRQI